MLEALIPIVTGLAHFFAEKLLEWGLERSLEGKLDKIRLAKIEEEIKLKIQDVLHRSIEVFPDGIYIVENFDLNGFFQNELVQNELSLYLNPVSEHEPDVSVLQDVWQQKLGIQLSGNYKLILDRFLRLLRQGLWEIKEVQGLLHIKEERVFQNYVKNQLEMLKSVLPSDDKNLNSDIELLYYKSNQVLASINYQLPNGFELHRPGLDEEFDRKFDDSKLIIIKGDAGAGKSAFAKRTITRLQNSQCIVLAFKADAFIKDSLNELFPGFHNSFSKVLDHLCQQQKIIIVIDSLEKLLEVSDYDALKELFRLCKGYSDIKIVLTCRTFAYAPLMFDLHSDLPQHEFLEIPRLEDAELDQVEEQFPCLANLFRKKSLRYLLKKPFYLNLLITHSEMTSTTDFVSENDFRNLIWQKVITKNSLPRSETFGKIAIQRAISMSMFVKIENPNLEAVKGLLADGIILADEKLGELYCPSHDIFEDIALIRYVEQIYQGDSDVLFFFEKLGGKEPAVRRAFRLWLNEKLYEASSNFSVFIADILANPKIDQYWKDETIISILNSNYSKNYFDSNIDLLNENDWSLFLRFVHILRTSCQEPDEEIAARLKDQKKGQNNSWLYLKPVGPGWFVIIDFIYNNYESLANHQKLIFRLIVKDWSKLISASSDLPPESTYVGRILISMLNELKNEYDFSSKTSLSKKDIDEGIIVLFKLCAIIPNEIRDLVQTANSYDSLNLEEKLDYHVRNFYESIIEHTLSGVHSREICKELPDLVSEIALNNWLKQEKQSDSYYGRDDEIDDDFNLAHNMDDFPPGIYQTPIRFLLYYHPFDGLKLITDILNLATQAYSDSDRGKQNGTVQITIVQDDGTIMNQIGDPVIWSMFRGTVQSTPYLLQSILMSLESWLLELCELNQAWADILIKAVYSYLLKNSNSVATTAVLSSVAMAYPEKTGKTCLPILQVKEFFRWDLIRFGADLHPFAMNDIKIPYAQEERRNANNLSHRKIHLELLLTKLQAGGYAEEINKILDDFYLSADSDDKIWKLALNRMDFRKYRIDETVGQLDNGQVMLRPEIDKDLTDFVEENQADIELTNRAAGITNWSAKVFQDSANIDNLLDRWREERQKYLDLNALEDERVRLFANPAYLAAIGIRDLSSLLSEEEKLWSIEVVIEVIQDHILHNIKNDFSSQLKFSPLALEPAIRSIPLVLSMSINNDIITEVKTTIFLALLHLAINENERPFDVIRSLLWDINKEFAASCFSGMLIYAKLIKEKKPPYSQGEDRIKNEKEFFEKELELVDLVCQGVVKTDISDISFDIYSHWHLGYAVLIIPYKTNDNIYRAYVEALFRLMFQALNIKDRHQRDTSRYTNTEYILRDYLAEYLLNQDQSYSQMFFANILAQVFDPVEKVDSEARKFIEKIVENLIIVNDKLNSKVFWDLMLILESKIKQTQKPMFVQYLFLSIPWWNSDADDWLPLNNKKQYFRDLIINLGHYDIKSVVRLLSGVGAKNLLPDGIVWLETIFSASIESAQKLNNLDEFFYTEKLIQKIYNLFLKDVKTNSEIKRCLLTLLDRMINAGSSLAFIIRERVISI